jgi:hypothetical protein
MFLLTWSRTQQTQNLSFLIKIIKYHYHQKYFYRNLIRNLRKYIIYIICFFPFELLQYFEKIFIKTKILLQIIYSFPNSAKKRLKKEFKFSTKSIQIVIIKHLHFNKFQIELERKSKIRETPKLLD